jgi:hypothetical protein
MKKNARKLQLKKRTIIHISNEEKKWVKGGILLAGGPTREHTCSYCMPSVGCETFEI